MSEHKNNITFSIIIPAFNEEKHIKGCLEHIFALQHDVPFEVIVVDNNSTDNTRVIAENFDTKIVTEKKQGVGAARRLGTALAVGKYILHIDADTHLPSNYISEVLKRFERNSDLVCVGGQMYYYDAQFGKILCVFLCIGDYGFFATAISFRRVGPMGNNMTFKKNIYDQTAGFDAGLQFGEDMDISRKLATFGKVRLDMSLKCFVSVRRFILNKKLFIYMFNFFKMCFTGRPMENALPHTEDLQNS